MSASPSLMRAGSEVMLGEGVRTAGAGYAMLQRCVTVLPRGRARIARLLAGWLHAPFVARVPPLHLGIDLFIDPADPFQLEIWLGAYQPHVVSFLLRTIRPGDIVLCAGLHVGYVAAMARRLAGPSGMVFSAEPDPVALTRARRNLALGDSERDAPIEILEGGLSDENGEMEMYRSRVLGHSSFASPHQVSDVVRVALRRGDDWLREIGVDRVDVMVLDVEGWEIHALRGLEQTMTRSRDLVALVEMSDWALKDAGSTPAELLDFFRTRSFDVRWAARHGRKVPFGVWGARVQTGAEALASDILCVGPHASTRVSPRAMAW